MNSVAQCILGSFLLQLIRYFINALVLTKSLFYKSVMLQCVASHLEYVKRGQIIFMEQSTLSVKHQYSSLAPILFFV